MRAFFLTGLLSLALTANAAVDPNLVAGFNEFAFITHQRLYQSGKSDVYSPYSIGVLMALLVNGSAGNTRDELTQALHITNTDHLNANIDLLNQSLTNNKDTLISNAFWIDQHFNIKAGYINPIKKMRSVVIKPVDFANHSDRVTNEINDWADKSTQGYIKTLLNEPIATNTKLVLTNAIYFKGLWALPFESRETSQEMFIANGNKRMLAMMHKTAQFNYTENDMLQLLILGYNNSDLVMAIALPKAGKELQDIHSALTYELFKSFVTNANKMPRQVVVTLPKFKIASTLSGELKDALIAAGIHDAFDVERANFSNLVSTNLPSLYISDTIQKAVIEVDEKGTVAAAASAVVLATRAMVTGSEPVVFKADHPFMFVIFDKVTGLILFVGDMQ